MVGLSPAIPVPDSEKLKMSIYQLFGSSGQGGPWQNPAADNAGAAVSAGWFTVC
jgi:hypothetical protein